MIMIGKLTLIFNYFLTDLFERRGFLCVTLI